MSVNATVTPGDAPGDAAALTALGDGLPSAASDGLPDGLMTATGVVAADASDAVLGGEVTSAVVVSVFFAQPAIATAAQRTKAGM